MTGIDERRQMVLELVDALEAEAVHAGAVPGGVYAFAFGSALGWLEPGQLTELVAAVGAYADGEA